MNGEEDRQKRAERADAVPDTPKVRRVPLRQILQSDREIEVEHEAAVYRLRLTAAGKLLLTK